VKITCFCFDRTIAYAICILLRQSFFRSIQCQIIYKFAEIPCKGSRSQSRLHCRPWYPGRSLKKFSQKEREKQRMRNVHCRVSRDITMLAWMRLLECASSTILNGYRAKKSFIHEQSFEKNPNFCIHPNHNRHTIYRHLISKIVRSNLFP